AEEHAPALVEVVGCDLDGRLLERQKLVAKVLGDLELGQTRPRLLGEMVDHLEIDEVGRVDLFPGPALVDGLQELLGDVEAEAVVPALLEPAGELGARVVIQHVYVELPLLDEAGEGEIAASYEADRGTDGVGAEEEVELGVEGMAHVELDEQLARPDLA